MERRPSIWHACRVHFLLARCRQLSMQTLSLTNQLFSSASRFVLASKIVREKGKSGRAGGRAGERYKRATAACGHYFLRRSQTSRSFAWPSCAGHAKARRQQKRFAIFKQSYQIGHTCAGHEPASERARQAKATPAREREASRRSSADTELGRLRASSDKLAAGGGGGDDAKEEGESCSRALRAPRPLSGHLFERRARNLQLEGRESKRKRKRKRTSLSGSGAKTIACSLGALIELGWQANESIELFAAHKSAERAMQSASCALAATIVCRRQPLLPLLLPCS